jgi:hypothetical protein
MQTTEHFCPQLGGLRRGYSPRPKCSERAFARFPLAASPKEERSPEGHCWQRFSAEDSLWIQSCARICPNSQSQQLFLFHLLLSILPLTLFEKKEHFSEHLVLFYNENGGTEMGIMWKPSFVFPKPFKVFHSYASFPVAKVQGLFTLCCFSSLFLVCWHWLKVRLGKQEKARNIQVMPNWVQILQQLRALGEGLVEDVVIQK